MILIRHEKLDIQMVLDYLDGRGLIITDEELIKEALKECNLSFDSQVI